MRIQTGIGALLLLVSLLGASVFVHAQGFPSPLGILPAPAESDQPLVVGVWTERSSYEVGEALVVHFSVNQPAFVYLFDLQPNGVVRLLFPNGYSQNSNVIGGTHTLPDGPVRPARPSAHGCRGATHLRQPYPTSRLPRRAQRSVPRVRVQPQRCDLPAAKYPFRNQPRSNVEDRLDRVRNHGRVVRIHATFRSHRPSAISTYLSPLHRLCRRCLVLAKRSVVLRHPGRRLVLVLRPRLTVAFVLADRL